MRKVNFCILLMTSALSGFHVSVANAETTRADETSSSNSPSTGHSATRVFINPKTGQLGGPPPGVEPPGLSIAVQQKLSRSSRGLEKRQLPNGTLLVNLQGRFQNMSVANVTPDGESHISCNHNEDQVEHALAHSHSSETKTEGDAP